MKVKRSVYIQEIEKEMSFLHSASNNEQFFILSTEDENFKVYGTPTPSKSTKYRLKCIKSIENFEDFFVSMVVIDGMRVIHETSWKVTMDEKQLTSLWNLVALYFHERCIWYRQEETAFIQMQLIPVVDKRDKRKLDTIVIDAPQIGQYYPF